jgi:uncharacterized protein DUF2563
MTFEGTNVNVDELSKFGRSAHRRADDTTKAADKMAGVHMGPGMLGIFSNFFLEDANARQRDAVSKLHAMAATLSDDGDIAATNAKEFDDTNTESAARFTNEELP